MPVKFDDIEYAFMFVSSSPMYTNSAYICKETGQAYYVSGLGDSDELPEDIFENDQYVEVPHKNELDLGKSLVLDFISKHLPNEIDRIHSFFQKKGAYSKLKDFLEDKDLLEQWYKFEEEKTKEALISWCHENNIITKG
jgi:hypothetical protein